MGQNRPMAATLSRHDAVCVLDLGDDENRWSPQWLDAVNAVLDEVADIKPEAWEQVIRASLSDKKGRAMFIGTPKGINLFSDLYNRAKALPDWFSTSYTVYDTDALDSEEVARLKRDMPEAEFAREGAEPIDGLLHGVADIDERPDLAG